MSVHKKAKILHMDPLIVEEQDNQQQPKFGPELPILAKEVVKNILKMLSIRDVFSCYQINRSWVQVSESIMEQLSTKTKVHFTCQCVAVYPKILGKYIDLEHATHICKSSYSRDPFDARLLEHLPNLTHYNDPTIDASQLPQEKRGQKLAGYVMRMLGTHCPKLRECDLGHQVHDDEFTRADAVTVLQGCPLLESLYSQNGFQLSSWGDSNLLSALKSGPYRHLSVPIGLRNPRTDMHSIIGGFVENPGLFAGTITTFPYCWNEHGLSESTLESISEEFNASSERLMERACTKGFTLWIYDMDWYP